MHSTNRKGAQIFESLRGAEMSDTSPQQKKKRKRKKEKKKKKDKKKKDKKEDRWRPDEPDLVFGTDGDGEKVIVMGTPRSATKKKKKKKAKHKSRRHSSSRHVKSGSPSSSGVVDSEKGRQDTPVESPAVFEGPQKEPESPERFRAAVGDVDDVVTKTPIKKSQEHTRRKPERNTVDLREELNAARSKAKGESWCGRFA